MARAGVIFGCDMERVGGVAAMPVRQEDGEGEAADMWGDACMAREQVARLG